VLATASAGHTISIFCYSWTFPAVALLRYIAFANSDMMEYVSRRERWYSRGSTLGRADAMELTQCSKSLYLGCLCRLGKVQDCRRWSRAGRCNIGVWSPVMTVYHVMTFRMEPSDEQISSSPRTEGGSVLIAEYAPILDEALEHMWHKAITCLRLSP